MPKPVIFTIDDEPQMHVTYDTVLQIRGYADNHAYTDPELAVREAEFKQPDIVLMDLMMGAFRGEDFIQPLRACAPHVKIIIISALNTVDTAMNCIRLGAIDYLVKPLQRDRLLELLSHITEEASEPVAEPSVPSDMCMVVHSEVMQNIVSQAKILAKTKRPVLILGETGTGKDCMANFIHQYSGRSGDMVKINVAGFDETTFCDTLLGQRKDSVASTEQDNVEGLMQKAKNGTLFLDEIGDLDGRAQIKLLRLLEKEE